MNDVFNVSSRQIPVDDFQWRNDFLGGIKPGFGFFGGGPGAGGGRGIIGGAPAGRFVSFGSRLIHISENEFYQRVCNR